MHACTHACTHTHTHMHTHTHTCSYVCSCTHTHARTHACTHARTHTHAQKSSLLPPLCFILCLTVVTLSVSSLMSCTDWCKCSVLVCFCTLSFRVSSPFIMFSVHTWYSFIERCIASEVFFVCCISVFALWAKRRQINDRVGNTCSSPFTPPHPPN